MNLMRYIKFGYEMINCDTREEAIYLTWCGLYIKAGLILSLMGAANIIAKLIIVLLTDFNPFPPRGSPLTSKIIWCQTLRVK